MHRNRSLSFVVIVSAQCLLWTQIAVWSGSSYAAERSAFADHVTTWGAVQRTLHYEYRLINTAAVPATQVRVNLPMPWRSPRQTVQYLRLPDRGEHREFTDVHGQQIVQYRIDRVEPGEFVDLGYVVGVTLQNMRWPDPGTSPGGDAPDLAPDLRRRYLRAETNYSMDSPQMRAVAKSLVEGVTSDFDKMARIHDYVIGEIRYVRDGTWDPAAVVLQRGTGSCSEYNYVLSGLCRLAGLPTRCVGGTSNGMRALPTTDTVFHRWTEVFLSGYGWFPVDCSKDANPIRGKRSHFGRLFVDALVWCHQAGGADDTLGWDYRAKARCDSPNVELEERHRVHWFDFIPQPQLAAADHWLLDGTGGAPPADALECAALQWHEASLQSRQRWVQALAAAGRPGALRWAAILPASDGVRRDAVRRMCATDSLARNVLKIAGKTQNLEAWYRSNESRLEPTGDGRFRLSGVVSTSNVVKITRPDAVWTRLAKEVGRQTQQLAHDANWRRVVVMPAVDQTQNRLAADVGDVQRSLKLAFRGSGTPEVIDSRDFDRWMVDHGPGCGEYWLLANEPQHSMPATVKPDAIIVPIATVSRRGRVWACKLEAKSLQLDACKYEKCSATATLPVSAPSNSRAQTVSWRQRHAQIDPKGDIKWAPRPFVYHAGKSVRYIDFENGRDAADGRSRQSAWKHHPWDARATENAAADRGVHTYVFKRGVTYRGGLQARDSGTSAEPIRLTSDPDWGSGVAIISGAVRRTGGWTKGTTNTDIPNKTNVWYADLDFLPRCVWCVRGTQTRRIPLARMPNWTVADPEDVKSQWWSWDNPGNPYFHLTMPRPDGRGELAMGRDTKHITGPANLYMGAVIWAEFGWVDGTPYPSYVQGVDLQQNALGFEGYLGSPKSRVICRYHRYYLEDKPHYLDDVTNGEFWFEKKGRGGRLHLILPDGQSPNDAEIEIAKEPTLVDLTGCHDIEISGLAFQFTNVAWNLTELPWQYNKHFRLKPDLFPAAVRVWGSGANIRVANCQFRNVNNGILMKAVNPGDRLDRIVVCDNELRETDHHGIAIEEGLLWGDTLPDRGGHLFDVKVLRNYTFRTGLRPPRTGSGNAINIENAQTLEIAGNVIERAWHAGINVRGAKISGNVRDCPLSRILIYQNKVTDAIRTGDDCGNIETWQGGPAYVFNNVSGNPGGFRNNAYMFDQTSKDPGGARFGMAYYLDGGFKNYFFNNIGWGLSKNIRAQTGATAMFQEIISYQNSFFNNTAYNFVKGSRRQAPQAGRNKFLGNVWDGIGDWVFWHTKPAKTPEDGNERDAGRRDSQYALETNAFTGNVFHDITGKYAAFKSSGQWQRTLSEARRALQQAPAIASDLGIESNDAVLRDPAHGDFRLAKGSRAADQGVKVFVPWPTYANVGEWNFYPKGDDPTQLIDEHWYMTPYYYVRDTYYKKPYFPLTGVNFTRDNFVTGPLEDWTRGAATFNGKNQYAFCPNDRLNQTLTIPIKFRWDKAGQSENRTVTGKDFKSPQVYDSNFLIEAYFKTAPGISGGLLCQKLSDSGYALRINSAGGVTFSVCGPDTKAEVHTTGPINDGKWHHVIAECDRGRPEVVMYVDGRKDATAPGIDAKVSLANGGDLYVGGTPSGDYFQGTFEFLRISLGTLADAKTDIDELYAWQFDGPFLYDFTGAPPRGKRDAGALESAE